jgi:uncharacterized protein (UPF0332 family)
MIADDLLQQAKDLLKAEPRRPRQTSLRRAVSASYYALFHEVCRLSADALVGAGRYGNQAWVRVYRALQHGPAAKRCKEILKRNLHPTANGVSAVFPALQLERHTADYDPTGFAKGRQEVERLISDAETAIADLRAMPMDIRLELFTSLLFDDRR